MFTFTSYASKYLLGIKQYSISHCSLDNWSNLTFAEYMDPSDYEDLQKMVSTMTDVMHELVQEITNEKDPVRKKREAAVEANNTWSDLADEIEILVRFLMDGMDVVKW